MRFKKAERKEDGTQVLEPGVNYFIDTHSEDYVAAMHELAELIPKESFLEMVPSGDGSIMVSYGIDGDPIEISPSIGKSTSFFYVLPKGMNLAGASGKLYGHPGRQTQGFWGWMAKENPKVFKTLYTAAETTVETTDKILTIQRDAGKGMLRIAAGLAGILLVFIIATKRRKY